LLPGQPGLSDWRRLADLLLTRSGDWRRRVDKRQGFPAGSGTARELRERVHALLADLAGRDDGRLQSALRELRDFPDPAADPAHWALLQSLLRLLPRLAARLLLVFRARGQVDHAQVALAALEALGDDDAPTELALRLDYRIEHLLVDEFQDTSSGQFELLRRLTRGWQEHNAQVPEAPRTLLLVGDAMQSIYGFRDANVGLFMHARDHGIGDLVLEPLSLTANFRSQRALVDWVNRSFRAVLPPGDDRQLGAVAQRPAVAVREGEGAVEIALKVGDRSRAVEFDALCERLETGLVDPGVRSIAVLARTRSHLPPLLARFRERGIPFAGRDLDALRARPAVRDLLSLCRVLHNRFDRFAWLSLLRAPWAALDHADLLQVSLSLPQAGALLDAPPEGLQHLAVSEQTRERLSQLRAVLCWAEHYRDRLALRVWVEACWLRLGGPVAAGGAADGEDAERFLQLIEALEQRGEGLDPSALEEAAARLYAAPGAVDAKLQVMTLHKSKGLEFDWVFMPALDAVPRRSDEALLLWDEVLLDDDRPAFLLDVAPAREFRADTHLYGFLKARQAKKRALEDARLLYVGCTRAAQRLFLSATLSADDEGRAGPPRNGSLLQALAPALPELADLEASGADPVAPPEPAAAPPYLRLQQLPGVEPVAGPVFAAAPVAAQNRLQRVLGTAVHRCLAVLPRRAVLPPRCDDALRALLAVSLREGGCEPGQLHAQLAAGVGMLDRLLADDWARWMLDGARGERAAEFPLTLVDDGSCRALVVDYSFVDERSGERWVVDYKTATPRPAQSLEDFHAEESARYAPQLALYRRALAALAPQPLRTALYFVALGSHHEVMEPPVVTGAS
jgi:ATP-dependent exoDNAse (exonuclease V) beta subunit